MQHSGMRTFFIIWMGQLVSLFGTGMTRFALIIWAYQQTGNATTLALMGFFGYGSQVVAGIFAGAWIDRFSRRKVLLLADTGAGLTTMGLLALFTADGLHIWHLYAAEIIVGSMDAFQVPAYNATIAALLPKKHFARASGMRSFSRYSSEVLAPIIAGVLLVTIKLNGVMIVDIITFLVAVLSLVIISIPSTAVEDSDEQELSFRRKLTVGLRFIASYQGLIGLVAVMTTIHFFAALTYFSILPAMILALLAGCEQKLSGNLW